MQSSFIHLLFSALATTYKTRCYKRYLDDSGSAWKVFLSHYLKAVGTSFFVSVRSQSVVPTLKVTNSIQRKS